MMTALTLLLTIRDRTQSAAMYGNRLELRLFKLLFDR